MSITYYVSSKLKHKSFWLESEVAHQIKSSWLTTEELTDEQELAAMWTRYLHEIQDCDKFLMYLEDEDVPKGALVELGAAFALGKPIDIIWTGTKDQLRQKIGTIVDHWLVDYYPTLEEAL